MRIRGLALLSAFLALPMAASAQSELQLLPPLERLDTVFAPEAIELADIDGDAVLDAVVVGRLEAAFACYRGVGDGSFGEEIARGRMYLEPIDLVVDDFNGDGLPDIAGINGACG